LSTTVISPTQVVLGRPTPYFVPSGERAQGPVNQNATPEHVPETDKVNCCFLFIYLHILFLLLFPVTLYLNSWKEDDDVARLKWIPCNWKNQMMQVMPQLL
jgi:hypothetical protein